MLFRDVIEDVISGLHRRFWLHLRWAAIAGETERDADDQLGVGGRKLFDLLDASEIGSNSGRQYAPLGLRDRKGSRPGVERRRMHLGWQQLRRSNDAEKRIGAQVERSIGWHVAKSMCARCGSRQAGLPNNHPRSSVAGGVPSMTTPGFGEEASLVDASGHSEAVRKHG